MTTKRTHGEIAKWLVIRLRLVSTVEEVPTALAALREAADAARQEERETLSVLGHAVADGIARGALGMHTSGCPCSLHELLRAVGVPADARSRAEEPISELPKKE